MVRVSGHRFPRGRDLLPLIPAPERGHSMGEDVYTALAEKHGYGSSLRYRRVLEFLMTPSQAAIVAELPAEIPAIAAKLGIAADAVTAELQVLFRRGVVFPKDFATNANPRFARQVAQLHDASQSILDLDKTLYSPAEEHELFRLWEDFCENDWYPNQIKLFDAVPEQPLRTVPAYLAIKDLPDVEPWEDMREILKAQDDIALCSCTCRKRRTDLGMACAHSHDVNCFQFNRGAQYAFARGTGRKLSYEEALQVVEEIERDGLVHNCRNDRTLTSMPVFCSCCIDCCMIWHPVDTHGSDIAKMWAKSRFQADLDQSACTGCQSCVDTCMFDAIEMVKVPGTKKLKARVDPEKCFGCGACVVGCDAGALKMKTVRPPEHVPEKSGLFPH
jgi:ferredoxin